MGAPKQKWTSEEERALKAGVVKHGTGKWRTILSDPQFSSALQSRSNVDLKDKWRNISVTALYGSRKKAKLAHKKNHNQDDDNSTALTIVALTNGDDTGQQIDPPSPLAATGEPSSSRDFQGLFASVDKILLNGIATLERPLGPDVKTIMQYVENNPDMQPDMKRLVTSRLKHLISVGTIVKIKHRYRITPSYEGTRAAQSSRQPFSEGNKENSPNPKENGAPNLSKSQVDGEVLKMMGMTIQEAAEVAAKAVAEAEFAKAEALEAAREAAEAEAEAEAAHILATAAMGALQCMSMT